MGTFHIDFDFPGIDCDTVIAKKAFYAGKKSYMMGCVGRSKKSGEMCGDLVHCRMKGINEAALTHHLSSYPAEMSKTDRHIQMFDQMCNGDGVRFLLNPEGKVCFEFAIGGGVRTKKTDFIRTVRFVKDEGEVEDTTVVAVADAL